MSEVEKPANAKALNGSVLTEIRRARLLRLDPDVLRLMAERTERKELAARTGNHRERDFLENSK